MRAGIKRLPAFETIVSRWIRFVCVCIDGFRFHHHYARLAELRPPTPSMQIKESAARR
jgi:hypothetical protein